MGRATTSATMPKTRDAPGVGAHAVLVVQADDYGITVITWGKPQGFSWDWARKYWRGSFEVEWVAEVA